MTSGQVVPILDPSYASGHVSRPPVALQDDEVTGGDGSCTAAALFTIGVKIAHLPEDTLMHVFNCACRPMPWTWNRVLRNVCRGWRALCDAMTKKRFVHRQFRTG
jgi:hypothetical protein